MDENNINEDYKKKYEILGRIGKGSYASVFKAKKKENDEIRAIKIIYLDDMDEEDRKKELELIINELNSMKICSNDNNNIYSVKFYEYLWFKDEFIIVMELCDNNLSKILKEKKSGFKPEEIYEIMEQLNETFRIMVKNNIVHRDIKLENILVKYENEEKNKFKVKLTDYGMSKQINKMKMFKTHAGTPVTMAPEILEGKKDYDNKCDLWSIGIIMYQLLFNKIPYIGENEIVLLNNIKKFGQKKLGKSDDRNLDNLIRSLLVYDPKKRIDWNKYFSHPFFIKNEDNNNKINDKNQFDYKEQYERGALPCKIVLLGESGVGKTSIISRYISNSFSSLGTVTPGSNFTTKTVYMEEEKCSINYEIWDTAGQEKYRALAKVFYKNAAVCILVYDITRRASFEEIKNYWIKEVKECASQNISK